ncbi:MAG TPA: BatD family protein, partial [Chitinophagaceae bacterium]
MKPYRYILFFSIVSCFVFLQASSQAIFKTIIPQRPIEVGESFQVQYIIENANELTGFSPPKFFGFRVVSGPNAYPDKSGTKKNMVFTLAAVKEGKLKIEGATCLIDGKLLKSNDATVEVLPVKGSDESSYFLKQGEDPYKKIQENLFLKLILDKQACFVGEPLVATFKLYSRLQSKSNIIKNPGFYGFSVYDMIDVNDKVQSEEKLDGHWFDVHT